MSKRRINDLEVEESAKKRLKAQLDDIFKDLSYAKQQRLLAALDTTEILLVCASSQPWLDACQSLPPAFWQQKLETAYGPTWRDKVRDWYQKDDLDWPLPDFNKMGFYDYVNIQRIKERQDQWSKKYHDAQGRVRPLVPPRVPED